MRVQQVIELQQRRACSRTRSYLNVRAMRIAPLFLLVACSGAPDDPALATGTLGAWQAGPALPTPRANHCSAVIDNWVLVIGGTYSTGSTFAKTDEIHASQLVDGQLGPWQLAGHTRSPVSECNATSSGRTLYIVDGLYDNEADSRRVWTAELDASGHIGDFAMLGALPGDTIAISSEASVHEDKLLLADTRLPAEGDTTVLLRAPLSTMSWTVEDWHIGFRAQAEYAFSESFVFTLGGYHDAAVGAVADVFVAPIDGGPATSTTALPTATAWGEAVAVDDWLYVVGGRAATFGAPGTTNVFAALIQSDGALGAWQPTTALPMPRTNHELVLVGDYLVLTGGATNGPGDTTVLVSQVRFSQSQ